jgi:hypothetical protein
MPGWWRSTVRGHGSVCSLRISAEAASTRLADGTGHNRDARFARQADGAACAGRSDGRGHGQWWSPANGRNPDAGICDVGARSTHSGWCRAHVLAGSGCVSRAIPSPVAWFGLVLVLGRWRPALGRLCRLVAGLRLVLRCPGLPVRPVWLRPSGLARLCRRPLGSPRCRPLPVRCPGSPCLGPVSRAPGVVVPVSRGGCRPPRTPPPEGETGLSVLLLCRRTIPPRLPMLFWLP